MELAFFITLALVVVFWRWFVGFAVLAAFSDFIEDVLRNRR